MWYYVGSFNMLVRNASPRGPMRFRGLMFSLSQDLVNYYFYFVLLPLGSDLW